MPEIYDREEIMRRIKASLREQRDSVLRTAQRPSRPHENQESKSQPAREADEGE